MCGGGNRYGVEGVLGHGWLRTPWRTLGRHQHHRGVGWRWVVRRHHTGLHMGLNEKESVQVCLRVRQYNTDTWIGTFSYPTTEQSKCVFQSGELFL